MNPAYPSYAIFGEFTDKNLGTEEMKADLANRVFNRVEASSEDGAIIVVPNSNDERIRLKPGVYRITATSFVSMLNAGTPPVPPVPTQYLSDVYPGYCMLYDANDPPTEQDMSKMICPGTMGTAYDSTPSNLECVLKVEGKPMEISLGHQCSYDSPKGDLRPKVYLRIGGTDFHVCARIAIYKIA